jgi:hypothetical protein
MIFQKHDFKMNFEGINASKDKDLQKQMILSEISQLIVSQRANFLEMMRMAGFNVDDNINDIDLSDMIIDNIGKNKKLATGIAYMITERSEGRSNAVGDKSIADKCESGWYKLWHNKECKQVAGYNAGMGNDVTDDSNYKSKPEKEKKEKTEKPEKDKSGSGGSNASGIISSVSELINGVFGYYTAKEEGANQAESDKMTLMNNLIAMKAAQEQPKSNNTVLYIVLGVVVLAGIGVGIYFMTKKKPVVVAPPAVK